MLVKPIIHSNGTPASRLYIGYGKAERLAKKLYNALHDIEFNQRDYYLMPDGTWEQAVVAFRALQLDVARIQVELDDVATHCYVRILDSEQSQAARAQVRQVDESHSDV